MSFEELKREIRAMWSGIESDQLWCEIEPSVARDYCEQRGGRLTEKEIEYLRGIGCDPEIHAGYQKSFA